MNNKEKAIKCYLDGLTAATKAFVKHQNLFIFYLNVEQAQLHAMAIISQPTPPIGGMVVHPNMGGDLGVIPSGEMKLNCDQAGKIIIGVDTGKPGGGWP